MRWSTKRMPSTRSAQSIASRRKAIAWRLKAGVDTIEHMVFSDDETIGMIKEKGAG